MTKKKYFEDIIDRTYNVNDAIMYINTELKENKHSEIALGTKGGNILKNYFENVTDDNLYAKLCDLVRLSQGLTGHIDRYIKGVEENHNEEQKLVRDVRKNERKDMWWSWGHKTLRWIISFILVIGLYSFVVYLGEVFDFIKIPVKDWFPKN